MHIHWHVPSRSGGINVSLIIMLYILYSATRSQETVAQVAEMIHTASLIHDDIIDLTNSRRGKPASHLKWGEKDSVLAGNYILSRATIALAKLGNTDILKLLSTTLDDLVQGIQTLTHFVEQYASRFSFRHRLPINI